eukprot:snap_masked-scaffold_31-processed-gene-3.22-mRNA-1 protein AED:0.16 eAED:0.19 QI:0/-1/0/1/-1/1/1/0/535
MIRQRKSGSTLNQNGLVKNESTEEKSEPKSISNMPRVASVHFEPSLLDKEERTLSDKYHNQKAVDSRTSKMGRTNSNLLFNGSKAQFQRKQVKALNVEVDNALFGDYDISNSQSVQNLLALYLEKSNLDRTGKKKKVSMLLPTDGKIAGPVFNAVFRHYEEGVNVILDDKFWKCFSRRKTYPWNFNLYLFPIWCFGCFIRYVILFPLRLLSLLITFAVFFAFMEVIKKLKLSPRTTKKLEIKAIQAVCGVFFFSWGAVIRYHGAPFRQKLKKEKNGEYLTPVFVANHSTMIDAIILLQANAFSLLGQRHKGVGGFFQDSVKSLNCVWFNRGGAKDRKVVSQKLKDHVTNKNVKNPEEVIDLNNPLLVFPEGTCVNNEVVIQFKKGVFDLGVPVVPVAIKYQKDFCNPFWSSRDQSFGAYLVELMTSWCLICDVYFMEPMEKLPGEDGVTFANRVKNKIAKKADLKNLDFDGYMKHWKPSKRYIEARQKRFSITLTNILASAMNYGNYFDFNLEGDNNSLESSSPYIEMYRKNGWK